MSKIPQLRDVFAGVAIKFPAYASWAARRVAHAAADPEQEERRLDVALFVLAADTDFPREVRLFAHEELVRISPEKPLGAFEEAPGYSAKSRGPGQSVASSPGSSE